MSTAGSGSKNKQKNSRQAKTVTGRGNCRILPAGSPLEQHYPARSKRTRLQPTEGAAGPPLEPQLCASYACPGPGCAPGLDHCWRSVLPFSDPPHSRVPTGLGTPPWSQRISSFWKLKGLKKPFARVSFLQFTPVQSKLPLTSRTPC